MYEVEEKGERKEKKEGGEGREEDGVIYSVGGGVEGGGVVIYVMVMIGYMMGMVGGSIFYKMKVENKMIFFFFDIGKGRSCILLQCP